MELQCLNGCLTLWMMFVFRCEKSSRIRLFDSNVMILDRKANHRANWMAMHGK